MLLIYDLAGQVTQIGAPGVTTSATYTTTGRLATVTSTRSNGRTVTLTYGYDASGNLSSLADSLGGLVSYEYDGAERLIAVTQTVEGPGTGALARRLELEYDGAGRRTALHRYRGTTGSTTPSGAADLVASTYTVWNDAGELTGVLHRDGNDAVLLDIDLGRDAVGNVATVDDGTRDTVSQFDGSRRLLSVDETNGTAVETYTYDAAGNRTASHRSASYTYSYELLESGHELRSDDDFDYEYDASGGLVRMTDRSSGVTVRLTTDHRGRLTQLTQEDADGAIDHDAAYLLDPMSRRIAETVNGQRTDLFYDGFNPVLRILPDGRVERRLYLGLDELVADTVSGATPGVTESRWFLADQVGSTRVLLSDQGQVRGTFEYDAFGELLSHTGDDTEVRFSGRPFDLATGFGDFRSRAMIPQLGRFAQMDPEFPYRYDYADSNPQTFRDPTGRTTAKEWAIIAKNIAVQFLKRRWKCITTVVVLGAGGAALYYGVGEGASYLFGGAFVASTLEFLGKVIAPDWTDPFSKAKEAAAKATRTLIQRTCN